MQEKDVTQLKKKDESEPGDEKLCLSLFSDPLTRTEFINLVLSPIGIVCSTFCLSSERGSRCVVDEQCLCGCFDEVVLCWICLQILGDERRFVIECRAVEVRPERLESV